MKKALMPVLGICIVACIVAFALFSTGSDIIGGPDNAISIYIASHIKGDKLAWLYEKGGINVIWGDELESKDTHGFHGDGSSLNVYQFSDSSMEPEMEESELWKKLPLAEGVSNVITNTIGDECAEDIPVISNGYYFFYDRSSEARNPYDESDLWNRYSINCTIAIYDMDNDVLYIYTMDT